MPRWTRVQTLFGEAADLPASQRKAFLDEACAGDDDLRREIETLLAHDQGPELTSHSGLRVSVLTQAISMSVDKAQRDQRQHLIGTTLGNYHLTSELGHGGAGTVYLGERADDQYQRKVAVKVLAYSLNEDIAYRFQAERYILAELTHPYIAKLFDAGETPDQQPYLVMEYVEGEPLDKYCDSRQLGIKERIELFLKVCSAVHYAHQHLVVHRDLKPGNILVTADGVPKLLDFGIAKWLDKSRLPEASQALTRINDRVLTPEYASPEQVTGRAIATTSDVYTLGVVLYELLSGSRPYQLPTRDHLEVERLICILDPTSPSHYFSSQTEEDQQRFATLRGETPKSLLKTLHGDLDAILMRTLRKEPSERYESVEQLTDDLDRYLNGAPVTARQGNWLYYAKRFVVRRRVGLSVAALFLVCISVAATVVTLSTQRLIAERNNADHQKYKADTASNFWLGMFDRNGALPNTKPDSALSLLDRAAEQIKRDRQLTPDIRARLLVGMGKSYQRQAKPQLAIPNLEEAEKYLGKHPHSDVLLLATTLESLGSAQMDIGDLRMAANSLNRGLQLLNDHRYSETEIHYEILVTIGHVVLLDEKPKAAEPIFRQALLLATRLFGPQSAETAKTTMLLAQALWWQNNFSAALHHAEAAAAIYNHALPITHPDKISTNLTLAYLLAKNNQPSPAKEILANQLDIQVRTYGSSNYRTAAAYDFAVSIERALGNLTEAKKHSLEALRISEMITGSNSQITTEYRCRLVEVLIAEQNYTDAETEVLKATRARGSVSQNDNADLWPEYLLAKIYSKTHRTDAAIALLTANVDKLKRHNASQWKLARSQNLLASLIWKKSPTPENKKLLVDSWSTIANPDNAASPELIAEAEARTKAILTHSPTPLIPEGNRSTHHR